MASDDPMFSGPVSAALGKRRSVRAFSDQAVPDAVIEAILTAALRAPSGGNLQPWHVHVVTGDALLRLSERILERQREGASETPVHPIYPEQLGEPYRSRRFQTAEGLYSTLGIPRSDKASRLTQLERNYILFDAPVCLFFTIDRRMGPPQWMDLGIFMQSVMLLAVEHELATCPQAIWALWPDTLRDELNLGDTMMVAAGMALGHEASGHRVNQLRTSRQAYGDAVVVHR